MVDALQRAVSEVMVKAVLMVGDDIPLSYAAQVMAEQRVAGLPVTDSEGKLAGVISWTDVMRALNKAPQKADPVFELDFYGPVSPAVMVGAVPTLELLTGSVGEHMSTRLVAVATTVSVHDAAKVMSRGQVHRVLVIDDDGNLAGLVSAIDIVHCIAEDTN
jgi:CBS domain-containing protein